MCPRIPGVLLGGLLFPDQMEHVKRQKKRREDTAKAMIEDPPHEHSHVLTLHATPPTATEKKIHVLVIFVQKVSTQANICLHEQIYIVAIGQNTYA